MAFWCAHLQGCVFALCSNLRVLGGHHHEFFACSFFSMLFLFLISYQVGYLDGSVNAKRLNFIAAKLRAKGWTASEITRKTHSGYFAENSAM